MEANLEIVENGENIWLNPKLTSLWISLDFLRSYYKFYQFWLNTTDIEAEKLIKIFTFIYRYKIEMLILEHRKKPHKRMLQQRLATELTSWGLSKSIKSF